MKLQRRALTLLTSVLISCCHVFAQSDLYKTLTVDGRQREFIIHLPPSYSSKAKLPILFGFHGGGGNYEQTIKFYNLNGLADKNGFIVIYPNAKAKSWTMPGFASRSKGYDTTVDDANFISVILDTIINYYKGDSNYVFTTGISRGGEFSYYLAEKLSSRITAIAPVCASVPKSFLKTYSFKHPTPVLIINGTEDPLIPYNGGFGKYLKTDNPDEGFDMAATEDLFKRILDLDSCNRNESNITLPDNDPDDDCTAIKSTINCGNINVILIKVINGGHTWPGGKQYLPKFIVGKVARDFNAEDEIFNFFLGIVNRK